MRYRLVSLALCSTVACAVPDGETGSGSGNGGGKADGTGCTVQGLIRDKYIALGGPGSFLGNCITSELTTPDGVGRFNRFEHGYIYWTPATGAHEVHGLILERWSAVGWELSGLGYPTSDEFAIPGGRESDFQNGAIRWSQASNQTAVSIGEASDCAIPQGAGRTIFVAIARPGVVCTRYPFPLAAPRAVLEAANGDLYVTEQSAGRLDRFTSSGFVRVTDGLIGPIGLAQSSNGALYVAEEGAHTVSRIDTSSGSRTVLAGNLANTTYLAAGPDQALYASSFTQFGPSGVIKRIALAGAPSVTNYATDLDVPEGLAFDKTGGLVVAEWNHAPARVVRLGPGGSATTAPTLASGFQHVYGVAHDAAGVLYVADTDHRVVRVLPDGSLEPVLTNVATPSGMTVTRNGDLLVLELVNLDFTGTGYLIRLSGL